MLQILGVCAVVTAGVVGFWAGYRLDARQAQHRSAGSPTAA